MTTAVATAETKPASSRINALDLMRGIFILVIASVHLSYYPSLFGTFDGRGQLWVSEAEGFFFISGLLIGLIRRRDMERSGFGVAAIKVLKRGWRLYLAGVILGLLYLLWGRLLVGVSPEALKSGLDTTSPWWMIGFNIFRLSYSYGWADFLIFYAGFLFVAPAVLWALRRGWWPAVLAATLGLWTWRWFGGYAEYNSFLQWQVYFFLGMMVGYYWRNITGYFDTLPPRTKRQLQIGVVALAVALFTVSALAVFGPRSSGSPLLSWIGPLNDNYLYNRMLVDGRHGLLRPLVLMVVFAAEFTLVRRYEGFILDKFGWLLLPFGRNSLYVYIVESLLLFAIPFFIKPSGFIINSLIEIGMIAIVWLCVRHKILFKIIPR